MKISWHLSGHSTLHAASVQCCCGHVQSAAGYLCVCHPALHAPLYSVWLQLCLWNNCSQTLLLTILVFKFHSADVTECLAAPESRCSSCVPYFYLPDVGAIAVSEDSAAWVCLTLFQCCVHGDIAYDPAAWFGGWSWLQQKTSACTAA